jgi:hypothetical protein
MLWTSPPPPSNYEEKLRGAVVLIGVTLSCEQFPEGLQFYADVESTYVVRSSKGKINVSPAKSLCFPEVVRKSKIVQRGYVFSLRCLVFSPCLVGCSLSLVSFIHCVLFPKKRVSVLVMSVHRFSRSFATVG